MIGNFDGFSSYEGRHRIIMGVETVHKCQGNLAVFSLPHDDIQKGHSVLNFNQGFGARQSHAGSQAAVEYNTHRLRKDVDADSAIFLNLSYVSISAGPTGRMSRS